MFLVRQSVSVKHEYRDVTLSRRDASLVSSNRRKR